MTSRGNIVLSGQQPANLTASHREKRATVTFDKNIHATQLPPSASGKYVFSAFRMSAIFFFDYSVSIKICEYYASKGLLVVSWYSADQHVIKACTDARIPCDSLSVIQSPSNFITDVFNISFSRYLQCHPFCHHSARCCRLPLPGRDGQLCVVSTFPN